ncbi:MAG: N-acetylmuramoyl-L-alanine amidase [Proteobacteria bacterium]|nr:MAG: N-acetylmuramoyl-L-alanine amidase [Pseudomonadota bacterium]
MEISDQKRRSFILRLVKSISAVGAALYAPSAFAKSSQALVKSVAIRDGRKQQRVVIELDKSVEHKLFTLSSPDRVVLDLKKARTAGNVKLNPGRPKTLISRLRYAPRNGNDLRIVLDMAAKSKAKTKFTKVGGKYKLEILLDNKQAAVAAKPASKKVASRKSTGRSKQRTFVIAIDPGHGGKDPGAVGGHGTYEKDVVLQIARRLKKRINKTKGMTAFMTRDGDEYLNLRQRVEKAHEKNADLFISVHADAHPNKSVRGSSVYILSEKGASSEMARLVKRENEAELRMMDTKLDAENPVLSEVLLDLTQSAAIDNSLGAAEEVLSELGTLNRLARKRVESADFTVLRSLDIPSMLVETAFISNPYEEKKLRTAKYQNQLANALYRGIRRYKVALGERNPHYAESDVETLPLS